MTAGLTLQRITDFEPPPGANPDLKPSASCDVSVNPGKSACMYYNFDTEQSPRLCSSASPSLPSCEQVDGQHVPDSYCMNTNLPSAGQTVTVTQIPGGRCGTSNFAFHLGATNLSTCYDPTTMKQGWGATLQITFNPLPTNSGMSQQVYDASSWDGISLWERRGTGSSGGAVLVSIQDPFTAATASNIAGFTHSAFCTDGGTSPEAGTDCFIQCGAMASAEPAIPGDPPAPDAEKCDPFGLGVGLTDDWQFVKIPFRTAEQKGFGVPSPSGQLDTSALVGLQLALSPGDWDVWIDDIAFYREPG